LRACSEPGRKGQTADGFACDPAKICKATDRQPLEQNLPASRRIPWQEAAAFFCLLNASMACVSPDQPPHHIKNKSEFECTKNSIYAHSTRTSRYESRSESRLVSHFATAVRATLHGRWAASKNECLTRAGKAVLTGWGGMPAAPCGQVMKARRHQKQERMQGVEKWLLRSFH